MNDYKKTKAELVKELEAVRRVLAKVKSEPDGPKSDKEWESQAVRQPRWELDAAIEFIADFDIIKAKGINISEGGICFELDDDLPFEMQFRHKECLHRQRACLIWVKRLSRGGYRFGLKFVPPEDDPNSKL